MGLRFQDYHQDLYDPKQRLLTKMITRKTNRIIKQSAGILLLILLAAQAPVITLANTKASTQFAAIARLLDKADNAFEQNKVEEATRLYGATVAAYEDLMTNFPDFQRDLIRFRIAYCENQIRSLLESPAATPPVQPPTAAASATQSPEQATIPIPANRSLSDPATFAQLRSLAEDRMMANPDDPTTYITMSAVMMHEGRLQDARKMLETALKVAPASAAIHYNLCQLILRDNKPDFAAAREHYGKAIAAGAPRDTDLETVINWSAPSR